MFLKNTEEWRTLACVKTKNLCIFKAPINFDFTIKVKKIKIIYEIFIDFIKKY